jgi:phosphate starvation-inducible PhoH-like protein
VLRGVEGISFVYLDRNDVVRHRLVKDIIDAYEKYHAGNGEGGSGSDDAVPEGK